MHGSHGIWHAIEIAVHVDRHTMHNLEVSHMHTHTHTHTNTNTHTHTHADMHTIT